MSLWKARRTPTHRGIIRVRVTAYLVRKWRVPGRTNGVARSLTLIFLSLLLCRCTNVVRQQHSPTPLADAHVHLSNGDESDLERLAAAGVSAVRDCGGDLQQLKAWREEIARGRRRGPRIYIAGPVLDGPKEGAKHRITVSTKEEAVKAVDSLADQGVDFIKTHNEIPRDAFFAVLRRARERGLPVAVHLPKGVPAWEAAEAGAGSIEHRGRVARCQPDLCGTRTRCHGRHCMVGVGGRGGSDPTAGGQRCDHRPYWCGYEASIAAASSEEARAGRAALMPRMLRLVGRLHDAGIPILAGSDLAGFEAVMRTQKGAAREVELLQEAGLSPEAARRAASPESLARWFSGE